MEGDFAEQVAVVSERVADERVVVIRHRLGLFLQVRIAAGNHEDLREGEGDTLAELVLRRRWRFWQTAW